MRLWIHKIRNWEYWPVYVVYTPTFILWIWFAIRFRSTTFYKHVNPAIKNGGLFGDSKWDIYQLIPTNLYPKTVRIEVNKTYNFQQLITNKEFHFPLIVKPDVGCRGVNVQRINSIAELMNYRQHLSTDFLIQETIEFPNEIGLFYCRLPNESKGCITGITIKKFLCVRGNDRESIRDLLNKNPRFALQINKLSNKIDLSEILSSGVQKCLVPFGNHNRGTEFLDGREMITKKLTETIDNILKKVDGFYYGRLDIRFRSFEELEQGLYFSIIEINGAKSEPTHIYDPKHSFWYGQHEILKHQLLFQRIIRVNKEKK